MHRRINHRHDWNYLDFSTYDLSVIRNRGNDSMLIPLKQKKKKKKKSKRSLFILFIFRSEDRCEFLKSLAFVSCHRSNISIEIALKLIYF